MRILDDLRKLTQPYEEDDEEFFADGPDAQTAEPTVAMKRPVARYAEEREAYRAPSAQRNAPGGRDYFAGEDDFYRDDTRVITRADNYREEARPVYREEARQPGRDSYRAESRPGRDYAQEFAAAPARPARSEDRVVNIRTATSVQVVLARPERFDQAAEIADHLREKRTVVMNLETTSRDIARRLVDFLSGVAYANDGNIKKVAINTYIITPLNVDIMGDLMDELENSGVSFY